MSSYHSSFTYRGKNSFNEGLIVVAFEPDDGFTDSFLSMDNISDEYYDGTKRFDYGSKYNTSPEIKITLIKKDGSDMSLNDFRSCAKWLTGAKSNSWLDMHVWERMSTVEFIGNGASREFFLLDYDNGLKPFFGFMSVKVNGKRVENFTYDYKTGTLTLDIPPKDGEVIEITKNPPIYSFLGKIINLEQYKFDARTLGCRLTFSSVSPWAYSVPQVFNCSIGQMLTINEDGILMKSDETPDYFIVDDDGVVSLYTFDDDNHFNIKSGIVGINTSRNIEINNRSDDLYTYIYLDIDYISESSGEFSVMNKTIGEETLVTGLSANEKISLSAKQFIMSDKPNKVFGDTFNFIWPRLVPGINKLNIDGAGTGKAKFTYRYPMKVGDCTMDIDVYGNGSICGDCPEHEDENVVFTGTIAWENITNTPTTISGYGIKDAYTKIEVDDKISNIDIPDIGPSEDITIDEQELNNMLADILG